MDNQVHNQIVSFIWGIADDCLRDVYVRGKYRDVILPMTVIRRLDAMLEETKPAVLAMKKQLDAAKIDNQWPALCNAAGQAFCNSSPFLLKDLTSRAKAQTLKADFIAYLDGFSPNVQVILDKYNGQEPALTSAAMNGFPDAKIPKEFKKEPYRILIVADMFQTGFDEPLLQTMYVDKPLYDIAAVQTLSRLNRACPGKDEVYVLDFANKTSTIEDAFQKFYRTTILSGETDPNKLYDLITLMESYQVYDDSDIETLVDLFLGGAERDRLDPILDACAAVYKQLELDDQIKFKSAAKSFVRTYGFLGAILPYGNVDWEKLSIFLNLLIPKLPSPRDDDFSEGILQTIDLSSYRNEAQEAIAIKLEDADAEIAPVPAGKVGHIVEPEMDLLSKIIMDFNDMFGNINWNDTDNVQRQILAIPEMVSRDKKYQNAMKNSDEQEARTESERALQQVIFSIMADNMELFKQFQDNPSFKKWLSDLVFNLTYNPEGKEYVMPESGGKADDYDFSTQESLLTAEDSASYGNKKDGK